MCNEYKDNKLMETFRSVNEASSKTNINCSTIAAACRDNKKTAGGYKWSYNKKGGNS